jgi:hypothetical protein
VAWEPESFSQEQRHAASKTIVRAQLLLDSLDCKEFGTRNAEAVGRAYSRVDVFGLDASSPQWPSAS